MNKSKKINKKSCLLITLLAGLALGSCIIAVKASPYDFVEELEQLKEKVSSSSKECWRWPAECRRNRMVYKLDRIMDLIFEEKYTWAYMKLLYDVKPKLTGLKTDENEDPWGFCSFYRSWINCEVLKEEFRVDCNALLSHLKLGAEYDDDVSAPFISITYSGAQTINDPGSWHIVVEDSESGIAGVQILVNGEETFNNQDLGGILEFSYDEPVPIAVGEHIITVVAINNDNDYEGDQESATESEWIEIIGDITPPIISSPADVQYEVGSTGNTLSWIASDEHPIAYTILLDGASFESGTWESSIPIEISADGLSVGTHEFLITVYDTYDNSAEDFVTVNVEEDDDITPPTITINYDGGHSELNPGFWIVVIEDPESGLDEVQILIDGVEDISESGLSGIAGKIYEVNVPGIEGTHIIEVNAFNNDKDWDGDQESNTEFSSVDIIYVPPIPLPGDIIPPIIDSPENVEYEYGSTGNAITWIASDGHPDTYMILLDGGLYESGIWTSGTPIEISVDGLAVGTHEFKITVYDTYDNYAEDSVLVSVREDDDITPPLITINYDGTYTTANPGEWIVVIEDPESGLDEVQILVNGIEDTFESGLNGILQKIYYINVPETEETHTIEVTALNNDKDWDGDQEVLTESSQVTIVFIPPAPPADDDMTPPTIAIYYEGGSTTANPGIWIVTIEDLESGIDEVHIYVDGNEEIYDFNGEENIMLEINVPETEGVHTIDVTAINNDKDWDGDQESATESSQLTIVFIPPIPLPPGEEPADETPPTISITYDGSGKENDPGVWHVVVEDPESGIGEIQIVVDEVEVLFDDALNGITTMSYDIPVSNIRGYHTINVTAKNDINYDGVQETSKGSMKTKINAYIPPLPPPEIPIPPGEEPADDTPPTISITYAGEFHVDIPGIWTVDVEDLESGLYEVNITVYDANGVIEYTILYENILGIPSISYDIDVPAIEGTHTIEVIAINAGQLVYTTSQWVDILSAPYDPDPPPIIS